MSSNHTIAELKALITPPDIRKPYAFISYSSADKEIVYKDVIKLQQAGVNIWIDKELDKYAGLDWKTKVLPQMKAEECRAVIFYISEASIASSAVCAELHYSKSKSVRKFHCDEALALIPISLVEGLTNIKSWINNGLKEHKKIKLDSEELEMLRMKTLDIDEKSLEDVSMKYDVCHLILEGIFESSNKHSRIEGAQLHDNYYYQKILDNIETQCPEIIISSKIEAVSEDNEKSISVDDKISDLEICEVKTPINIELIKVNNDIIESSNIKSGIIVFDKIVPSNNFSNAYIDIIMTLCQKHPNNYKKALGKFISLNPNDFSSDANKQVKSFEIFKETIYVNTHSDSKTKVKQIAEIINSMGIEIGNEIVFDNEVLNEIFRNTLRKKQRIESIPSHYVPDEDRSNSSSHDMYSQSSEDQEIIEFFDEVIADRKFANVYVEIIKALCLRFPNHYKKAIGKHIVEDQSAFDHLAHKVVREFEVYGQKLYLNAHSSTKVKIKQIAEISNTMGVDVREHIRFSNPSNQEYYLSNLDDKLNDYALDSQSHLVLKDTDHTKEPFSGSFVGIEKIGQNAKRFIMELLSKEVLDIQTLRLMTEQPYATKHLKLGYPLLSETRDKSNSVRYYSDPAVSHGITFYICSQWYEGTNRESFEKWKEEMAKYL